MNGKIIRKNPETMPSPVGNYTQITRVPKNAELIVTSGQVGVDKNGTIPKDFNEQVKNTFINIKRLLETEEISSDNIIKVNIWATESIDWDFLYAEWDTLFQTEYPAMTIGYISELGLPDIKIEIEIWAAEI
ncbi:RidA family protein [Oceanobacillus jeddahense]|uniref:RidA family protein n=1 Tax=Oceanobacillus jeddahense TaxID=1462527 RepID=A0ABY5JNM0_9BACI|nr:RidA family protein [Oceanobacillus jeddahense]UUI01062.1 RidA family protein [Oceanobacillus jeddahense]